MRLDENDNECPETLAEYREAVVAVFGDDNGAIRYLDEMIAELGPNEKVVVSDYTMRQALYVLALGVEDDGL